MRTHKGVDPLEPIRRVGPCPTNDEALPIAPLLLGIAGITSRNNISPGMESCVSPIHRNEMILYSPRVRPKLNEAVTAAISEEGLDAPEVSPRVVGLEPARDIVGGSDFLKEDSDCGVGDVGLPSRHVRTLAHRTSQEAIAHD